MEKCHQYSYDTATCIEGESSADTCIYTTIQNIVYCNAILLTLKTNFYTIPPIWPSAVSKFKLANLFENFSKNILEWNEDDDILFLTKSVLRTDAYLVGTIRANIFNIKFKKKEKKIVGTIFTHNDSNNRLFTCSFAKHNNPKIIVLLVLSRCLNGSGA